jgi:putative membrane protein
MRTVRRARGSIVLAAMVLGGFSWGCDDDNTSSNNPGTGGTGGLGRGTGGNGTGGNGIGGNPNGGTGGSGSGGSTAAVVTDGAALGIMLEANGGEVQTGQVALPALTNADVRAFAMQIVADHTGAIARLQAIAASEQLAEEDSPQRRMVQAEGAQAVATLQATPVAAIDATFVSIQVRLHTSVLNMLDTMLIPNATNAQFKAELQMERAAVQMHLTHAQALDAQLGAGGADGGTGADGGATD